MCISLLAPFPFPFNKFVCPENIHLYNLTPQLLCKVRTETWLYWRAVELWSIESFIRGLITSIYTKIYKEHLKVLWNKTINLSLNSYHIFGEKAKQIFQTVNLKVMSTIPSKKVSRSRDSNTVAFGLSTVALTIRPSRLTELGV